MRVARVIAVICALFAVACPDSDSATGGGDSTGSPDVTGIVPGDALSSDADGACLPDCEDRTCGSDGCGGSCGNCGADAKCTPAGTCQSTACVPQCGGKECGKDGCGGSCGTCEEGATCNDGACKPTGGLGCGDGECSVDEDCESCPGDCGSCPEGPTCGALVDCLLACDDDLDCVDTCLAPASEETVELAGDLLDCLLSACGMQATTPCLDDAKSPHGACAAPAAACGEAACTPACGESECGPDGCGGQCGQCDDGAACVFGMCSFECEPEMRVCVGPATVAFCTEAGTWGETKPCPDGMVCADGECTPGQCEPSCGPMQCGPDGCGGTCGECPPDSICSPIGQCVPVSACDPGETQCSGSKVLICKPNGQWSAPQSCQAGLTCKQGKCVPGDCKPACGDKECGGDGCGGLCGICGPDALCKQGQCVSQGGVACGDLVDCSLGCSFDSFECISDCMSKGTPEAQGQFQELFSCILDVCPQPTQDCVISAAMGQCVTQYNQCVGGCAPQCSGKQCGPDGCGGSCGSCADGTPCSANGQCGGQMECLPGQSKCEPGYVILCSADGTWYEAEQCPEGSSCTNGQCGPWMCKPGQTQCKGPATASVCNDQGQWSSKQCPSNTQCTNGACVPATACVPGKKKCDGNSVVQCGQDGVFYLAQKCSFGSTCVNAQCISQPECQPGETTCEGSIVLQCGPDGQWHDVMACPPGTTCSGGTCTNTQPKTCAEITKCAISCPGGDIDCMFGCADGSSEKDQVLFQELAMCVFNVCGTSPDCYEMALSGPCSSQYQQCVGGCTPQCGNKECGGNGCGGSCGSCGDGEQCSNGVCVGQPVCAPGQTKCSGATTVLVCTNSGQWAAAKTCQAGTTCSNGACVSKPTGTCSDVVTCNYGCSLFDVACFEECEASAGPDGQSIYQELDWCVKQVCGSSAKIHPQVPCAIEALQTKCSDIAKICQGQTSCVPQCGGKQCGPDGCGGTCGSCPDGASCTGGVCQSQGTGCYDMLVCMSDCNDDQCAYDCYYDGSPAAQQMYADLSECMIAVCGQSGDPGCYEQAVFGECQQPYYGCLEN